MAELRLIGGLLLALGLATVAAADPIQPPAGWTLDPHNDAVNRQAYTSPPGDRVALAAYQNRSTDSSTLFASQVLDGFHGLAGGPRAGNPHVVEDRWSVARHDGLIDATLALHFDGTIEVARAIVAADRAHPVAVYATCVLQLDKAIPPQPAWRPEPPPAGPFGDCRRALATLDPGIAPADRVAIDDAPPAPAEPMSKLPELGGPAHMGDGSHIKLPPIAVPPPSPPPTRARCTSAPELVVLAAAMWWNRRRRERVDDDSTDLSDAAKGSDHDDR